MMTVLNLTAETESGSLDSESFSDDVVIRLNGHEIWRDTGVWDRYGYGDSGIREAVESFATRLQEVLQK